MTDPVYLDHHAHTPLDPEVRAVLTAAWMDHDVNMHAQASETARRAVEAARGQVAHLLGAAASEIIFTSGATEANNLAILGLAEHFRRVGRCRLVVSAGEHPSVLATAESLRPDFEVVRAPLQRSGQLDLRALADLVTDGTGLVSVAAANHEVGTVQPLTEIGAIAASKGALFHSDLAQAAGKIPLDLRAVQLASVSAHKLYGPLGIGALMVRRPIRRTLRPLFHGGGQEGGVRSGTVAAPLCIAFGAACARAHRHQEVETVELARLRDRMHHRLAAEISDMHVNGDMAERLPGNLNVSFPGVDAEALVMRVRAHVTLATGSACNAQSLEPSHVLLAIGLTRAEAEGSVRIGLGRSNTVEEVDAASDCLVAAVHDLRALRARVRA